MFTFNYITEEDMKGHNPNCPKIPEHPYRTLIIEGSEPEKNKWIA